MDKELIVPGSEIAKAFSKLGAAKGGKARAAKLSPEERKEIARNAVEQRWAKARERGEIKSVETLKATHEAEALKIGNAVIPCAVLTDKTRVLSQQGFLQAIGRARSAKGGQGSSVDNTIPFLAAKNLEEFISDELRESTKPILYRTLSGARAYGYNAELLPQVCEIYLKVRDAGKLVKKQEPIAAVCEMLIRGFARVGIIALIDEATGYQQERVSNALSEILDLFLAKEKAKWVKRFPLEFYKEIFRLRKWEHLDFTSGKRPSIVATYTIDLIYSRLAPGIVDELDRLNPPVRAGRRKDKHHQWLTQDIGHPRLSEHMHAVISLMRAYDDWDSFMISMNRVFQRFEGQLELALNMPAEELEDVRRSLQAKPTRQQATLALS